MLEFLDMIIWAALGLFFVGVSVGIGVGLEIASRNQRKIEELKHGNGR